MEAIKEFQVDTEKLSSKEKALLERLIQAAKLITPLYLKQKNNQYPGANFYPPDATKEEIEEAAKRDPAVLNPYTFVERDGSGGFRVIPFHIKFKEELNPVAKLLREAAQLSEDEEFARYLESRAQSLMDGDYERSEIVWLTTGLAKFGFVIGPIERYIDKLFFRKCAYQAWVGILDEEQTKKAERLKDMVLRSRSKSLPKSERVDVSKLGIRIDKTVIFSGLIADFMFTGTNLPNDVNLMKKYGSNLTIFDTPLRLKFKEDQFPIFKAVFAQNFHRTYTEEELYQSSLRCILFHEIAHSLIRYQDAEERLGDIFPVFDEILAYILGIRVCGPLLLKGALTQKELEAILIMHICRNFTWWLDLVKSPEVKHYAVGAAIAMNFFFREGAMKIKGGISWPDFSKLFICIDELFHILEYYLALGSYSEAREFIEEYGSFEVFERFAPRIEGLKKTGDEREQA